MATHLAELEELKCPLCGTKLTNEEYKSVKQELKNQVDQERKKEIEQLSREHETERRSPIGEETSASKIATDKTAKNAAGNRRLTQIERRFTKDQLHFTEDNSDEVGVFHQMKPQDYVIEDVEKYDRLYLIEVVKYLHTHVEPHNKRIDALEHKAEAIMKVHKVKS